MVTSTRISMLLVLAMTACGFPRPDNVAVVSGQVHGLWNGTDGVTLRLQSDGIDTLLIVPADGAFSFPEQLALGETYAVTVAASAPKHMCTIDSGGSGTIADIDNTNVSVMCTGPEVAIALSGQWGWKFDPFQETQTFAGSIIVQDVALTVSGNTLTSVNVDHMVATLGKQTPPIVFPLGLTTIPISLTAMGGLSKTYQLVFNRGGSVLDQVVYGKASNTKMNDSLGVSVAVSGDTLAVSAPYESSNTTGINGYQGDNSASGAGAVYVFVRSGTTWNQQAYIKASNTGAGDSFGTSIALSGNTLAVGAPYESSNATGINGSQGNDSANGAGAAYVFVRDNTTWTQQAYIKASNTGLGHNFGTSVALSGDTLAVSGNQLNRANGDNGDIHIFVRNGTTWMQQQYLTAPYNGNLYYGVFTLSTALSGDTLAVTAQEVNQLDGHAGRGGVYIFARNGMTWSQQTYLTASSEGTRDRFGTSVALSSDTLAISAPLEVQGDMSGAPASTVHIYVRSGTMWAEQAQITGSNTTAADDFGISLALSGDTLAVGAHVEASSATGVNGDQTDNGAIGSGAVYIFARNGTIWTQHSYVKASNTGTGDAFGISVALSGDTLIVGASGEGSNATGVNPVNGQTNDGAKNAGAVYIFR